MTVRSGFVPKALLLERLQELVAMRESGLLTILTESRRSIFLRFSQGRLTRVYCRSGDTGEAIGLLARENCVRFTCNSAPEQDKPELMPAESFMQLIAPAAVKDDSNRAGHSDRDPPGPQSNPLRTQMLEIALEHIGIAAEIVVEEAFESNGNIALAIEYIGDTIPDPEMSRAFRMAARRHFSSLGD